MARPSSNGGLAIAELERMLDQRKSDLTRLKKRRAEVERELAGIDRQIENIEGRGGRGGGAGRGRRGGPGSRPRNEQSLNDTIEAVLSKAGEALKVGDIVEGVSATGYRSTSANFRGIVNQTLIKDKRFQSAGRGLYQLKSEGRGKKAKAEEKAE